jgi:hypothetical protein
MFKMILEEKLYAQGVTHFELALSRPEKRTLYAMAGDLDGSTAVSNSDPQTFRALCNSWKSFLTLLEKAHLEGAENPEYLLPDAAEQMLEEEDCDQELREEAVSSLPGSTFFGTDGPMANVAAVHDFLDKFVGEVPCDHKDPNRCAICW